MIFVRRDFLEAGDIRPGRTGSKSSTDSTLLPEISYQKRKNRWLHCVTVRSSITPEILGRCWHKRRAAALDHDPEAEDARFAAIRNSRWSFDAWRWA